MFTKVHVSRGHKEKVAGVSGHKRQLNIVSYTILLMIVFKYSHTHSHFYQSFSQSSVFQHDKIMRLECILWATSELLWITSCYSWWWQSISLWFRSCVKKIKFIIFNTLIFSHHAKTIFIKKNIIIVCEKRERSELRAEIKKCEMDSGLLYLLIVSGVARIQVWHQPHTFPHSL